MSDDFSKLPRLYMRQALQVNMQIDLNQKTAHYLRAVLRRSQGDQFRVFNGQDGEFIARITDISKKSGSATLTRKIKEQDKTPQRVHLIFAPLKKHRMDIVIEKCTELGVTDFHPILTQRTEVRKINAERITAQITEAAEQCERMEIPALHTLQPLEKILQNWNNETPIYGCLERGDHPHIKDIIKPGNCAFIIGPVGGFTDDEIRMLSTHPAIQSVSLGPRILRAETASLYCLAQIYS